MVDENNNNLISNVKTNGRFHTNWLNMIYPRLYLARNLLKEDGIIFISIDDNEYARLKLVCDEIFGEKNFICSVIWQKKNSGAGDDSKFIKVLTEFILVYSKNSNVVKFKKFTRNLDTGDYSYTDEYLNRRGKFKLNKLDRAGLTWSEKLDSELFIDGKYYYPGNSTKEQWLERKTKHAIKDWRWRWSYNQIQWGLKNDFIVIKNGNLYSKQYQFVDEKDQEYIRESPFPNIILNDEISGSTGTEDLKKLYSRDKVFTHPKPVDLMRHLIFLHPNKNALVLDFFAGSGTTGQAVMELNKEDGGNRNFILVQLEEKIENNSDYKNIAEITIDRIKKAIEKYEYEKDKKFKVFKVKDTNFKNYVFENINGQIQLDIQDDNFGLKKDTKNLSLIYEIILKKNYELNTECKEIKQNEINYWVISNKILIFLDNNLAKDNIDYSKVLSLIENYWKSLDDEIQKIGITIIFNDNYFIDDQSKVNLFLEINNLSDQIKIEVF